MNIIVCLDDKNGMMFHQRRQSTDRELRKHILRFVAEGRLWMSPYTSSQFSELPDGVKVEESFLSLATGQDYCFVESGDWEQFSEKVDRIVVYRWNRSYPADVYFPEMELTRRKLVSREDFAGYSHDKITQEVDIL